MAADAHTTPFPCPCCGHRTFAQAPPNSWEICPVCFWEDAPPGTHASDSSGVSLLEAQRNYARLGACAARWTSEVRAPRPHESKPDGWMSIDARRPIWSAKMRQQLESAFGQVRRDGGVSLHQSHILDEYGDATAMAQAAALDPEAMWQDIPEDKLTRLDGAFPFFDAAGYRFYVPAYLRMHARYLAAGDACVPGSGLWWYSLDGGDFYRNKHYALLDDTQRAAIAAYLHGISQLGAPDEATDAASFLATYWAAFLRAD